MNKWDHSEIQPFSSMYENINILTANRPKTRLCDFFFFVCHSPRPGEKKRKIAVKSART